MAGGIARRYARAAFEIADERGQLDDWLRSLKSLGAALSAPDIVTYLQSPSVQEREKETIHGAARMSGQLTVQGTTGAVPSDGGPAGGQSTSGSGDGGSGSSASDTTYEYGY